MKKKLLVVALGLSSSMMLGGCGGGSDDNSGSAAAAAPTATPVFYNAKIIDGYLKNAEVWLDVNGDSSSTVMNHRHFQETEVLLH